MALGLLVPLRVAQGVFAVVVIGLSSYVSHWYNADTLTASPSQVNFLIFAPLFSFLSLVYLEVGSRYMKKLSHPYATFALECVNMLFYFAGFIALAAFLGKLLFCRGSVCSAAKADATFAAFSWLVWTASTAVTAMDLFRGGFKGAKTDASAKTAMKEVDKVNTMA